MAPRRIGKGLVRMQSPNARVAGHRKLSVILLAIVKPKQGFLVVVRWHERSNSVLPPQGVLGIRPVARMRCSIFCLQLNWIHTIDKIVVVANSSESAVIETKLAAFIILYPYIFRTTVSALNSHNC